MGDPFDFPTLEDFADHCKEAIADFRDNLDDPEDDLVPTIFVETATVERLDRERFFVLHEGVAYNGHAVIIAAADPQFLGDEASKNTLFGFIVPKLITDTMAVRCAFASSVWMVEGGAEALDVRPSEHPNRVEYIALFSVDAERVVYDRARIVRRKESPPKYRKWIRDNKAEGYTGRMIEPMQRALLLIKKATTDPEEFLLEMFDSLDPEMQAWTTMLLNDPDFKEFAKQQREASS
jgi:hypothetical protein